MNSPLFTTREAAERLGVSRSTVQRWIDANIIKAHRTVGKHRRVSETDLRRISAELGIPFRELDQPTSAPTHGIMIVDDEPLILTTLELALRKKFPGVAFHATSNSFAAGAMVMLHKPKVLLLDINMPGLDGIEICRAVREMPDTGRVHIAAITAYHFDRKLMNKFTAAGGEQVFAKPFATEELFSFIEKSLQD